MRVLIVNYEFPPIGGGAATATLHLGHALIRLGHEVCVLTSAFGNLRGESMEDGLRIRRVPALRRLADRASIREMSAFAVSGLLALPAIVRSFRPDRAIVMFTIPCGHIGLLLQKLRRVPYVVSLRGGDVPGHVPHLDGFHRALAPIRRAVLANATAVVANSEGLAALAMRSDAVEVEVIPNGVDCTYFIPCELPAEPGSRFAFLFVGRFSREKNVDRLIEQIAMLPSEERDRVVLKIVGDGPLREELVRRASDLGVENRVTWLGWVDRARLQEIYRSSHCLVNPSSFEGMPNSVLEAMASGLPVVASAVRGNSETVVDGETGILFDLDRPEDFQSALRRLASDRELAHAMGARGRALALSRFSWDHAAERYMNLFEHRADAEPESVPRAGDKTCDSAIRGLF